MHTKQLFIFVVSAALLFLTPAQIWGLKAAPKGSLSIRQEFDTAFANLEKNLKKEKALPKKIELVVKFRESIAKSRNASPRQFESDEVYMDLLVSTLAEFPDKIEFKKKECPTYQNKILRQLSPSESEPVTPAVEKGLKILKLLCV